MNQPTPNRPAWLKSRGYLHITPKIDVLRRHDEIMSKVQNERFVERHAFFPLIHALITERKYKKVPGTTGVRAHSYFHEGKFHKSAKPRPLHYATHIDSMIFGYYAELLSDLYEKELKKNPLLDKAVIAYRKIPVAEMIEENKENVSPGKSTIHFAHEAFEEIKKRTGVEGCITLMFDIKSFFSELNHVKLKKAWCQLLNVERLKKSHFNVFNAVTNFRYILLDDLRIKPPKHGRKNGFDERKLAYIRKTKGVEAFFESTEDFRNAIKNKQFKVYKHPFMKEGKPVGIPQGLPISTVLANIYLLDFDKEVIDEVVLKSGGFYRRYSDDILIICKLDEAERINKFIINCILKSGVEISTGKTEKYLFKYLEDGHGGKKLTSMLLAGDTPTAEKPLTYLGFEFYGDKILIKSANLAKFYRRLIFSVKRKANRAIKIHNQNITDKPIIFRGQLMRKYMLANLDADKIFTKRKFLKKNPQGEYSFEFKDIPRKHKTNYLSYVKRASSIMNEPAIERQIRSHKRIFNAAITKHLKK